MTEKSLNMALAYPSPLVLVETFHLKFGHPVRVTPHMDIPERVLRVDLIAEEVKELMDAAKDDDFVEVIDAIADILYVTYGAALCHGINVDYKIGNIDHVSPSVQIFHTLKNEHASLPTKPVFSRIALAKGVPAVVNAFKDYKTASDAGNISKLGDALIALIFSSYSLARRLGVNIDEIMEEVQASNMSKLGADGKPIYREDGKILKGPGFFTPDIAKILQKQGL